MQHLPFVFSLQAWNRVRPALRLLRGAPLGGHLVDRLYRRIDDGMIHRISEEAVRRAPRFRAAYERDFGSIDEPRDSMQRLHNEFAFGTVSRGERTVRTLEAFAPVRGKRCLDVGCAYGGFSLALAANGAAEVVGIDLEPRLLGYARALLDDHGHGHGHGHGARCRLLHLDVLSPDAPARLGRFDVIVCNDVIEHVADPRAALARLVELLDGGGRLLMEIPNRHAATFLGADGHFRLFGISALPKRHADRYHALTFPGHRHDVTYHSEPFYLHALRHLGATVRLLNEPPATADALDGALARIAGEIDQAEAIGASWDPPLPDELKRETRRRVAALVALFRRQHQRYQMLQRSNETGAARTLGVRLWRTFGLDFWRVLVEKPAVG